MTRGTATTAQLADNYFLAFAPLSSQTGDSVPEFGASDFFTALQKQAGLKLEPGKDNLEVVVIDHMERIPTEN